MCVRSRLRNWKRRVGDTMSESERGVDEGSSSRRARRHQMFSISEILAATTRPLSF